MKLSVSLATVLTLLPMLVTASSSPFIERGIHDTAYLPRVARRFGRNPDIFGRQNNAADRAATAQRAAQQAAAQKAQQEQQAAIDRQRAAIQSSAAAQQSAAAQRNRQADIANGNNRNGGNGGNQQNNNNNNQNNNNNNGATRTTSAAAAATTTAANNGGNNNNNNNGGNNGGNNNNNAIKLDPSLVASNLAKTGQETPAAGQVASLTSTNNFINFCAGKTITNGQQITTGSCNPIPIGDIAPKANMPSCKFVNPINFSTIPANKDFTIQMKLNHLQAGVFTNAQKTYYMAPQQLNGQGDIIGHTHFVVQKMGAFDDPTILDAGTFQFFKGINTAAVNGIVSTTVTGGVPPGNYRLASINTDANHAPAIVAVAQHGFVDDMIYFTAK